MLLTVLRTLGGGPYAEVGRPTVSASSPDGERVAIAGELGSLYWPGDATLTGTRGHRLGVYRDGSCEWLVQPRWPVRSLAFHPGLPLLAIGIGSYDGGFSFEGDLLLLDLGTGKVIEALGRNGREIRQVGWADTHTLRVLVAPLDDDELDEKAHTHSYPMEITGDDWTAWPRIELPHTADSMVEYPTPPLDQTLTEFEWSGRTHVWAVECLDDGRVLAALESRELECWGVDGELEWEIAEGSSGRQIAVSADGLTAWVNSEWPDDFGTSRDLVLLATGQIIEEVEFDGATTMTSSLGWIALRGTAPKPGRLTLVDAFGDVAEGPELTGFDPANHPFAIRRATELLFLQGDEDKPWRNKWVVAVDPYALTVRRLFPLDWQGSRQLFGGPGVMLEDDLVHAGTVYDSSGLQPGGSFVVRRALADGSAYWVFTTDSPATAIGELNGVLYVGYANGDLVALDAALGNVRWRTRFTLDGQPAIPLSLATAAPNRLVIGTTDGRIADCRVRR
ncbi:hypothetical protein [Kribbella ginsengisoli]|uniref:Pyrroloquinoline-quinone binding quinoprotein n=1 Tax=Kribbella ginsengisoli TaxID=363865 RepID=A0ABP6YT15_9ACTN